MDSLRLKGPLAEILGAEDLQPSPAQLMLPIHRPEDDVVRGETSLSFSLQVVHSRVQRVRGEIKEKRLSLTDAMVPLVEPLSSKSLTSEASTSATPATSEPITTLSMTFASSNVTFHVRGRAFPLRSLSLYAPLPKASVTSYGPSHLGPSLPPSSAWLASFLR
ncbi:hypothetical protein Tco_0286942 [Tanacetum coccineum]